MLPCLNRSIEPARSYVYQNQSWRNSTLARIGRTVKLTPAICLPPYDELILTVCLPPLLRFDMGGVCATQSYMFDFFSFGTLQEKWKALSKERRDLSIKAFRVLRGDGHKAGSIIRAANDYHVGTLPPLPPLPRDSVTPRPHRSDCLTAPPRRTTVHRHCYLA